MTRVEDFLFHCRRELELSKRSPEIREFRLTIEKVVSDNVEFPLRIGLQLRGNDNGRVGI